jgi:hypothetical protein
VQHRFFSNISLKKGIEKCPFLLQSYVITRML